MQQENGSKHLSEGKMDSFRLVNSPAPAHFNIHFSEGEEPPENPPLKINNKHMEASVNAQKSISKEETDCLVMSMSHRLKLEGSATKYSILLTNNSL